MKLIRLSVEQVVKQVRDGHITVDEVKRAYVMRALDVAVPNNYIAEICQLADQAIRSVDVQEKVKLEHLLYGLTFSLSDNISLSGFDSTCGLASHSLKPLPDDAVIVKALKNHLLATPLFRSSVNQSSGTPDISQFSSECSNSLYGRALNPHNKDFSTGGSCGGEAGLVASNSIGIGFGVDWFGDARYPAACCGVAAFKPTSGRMSEVGVGTAGITSPLCKGVVTPMARSVKDISYVLRALWDSKVQQIYDKSVSPLKFNNTLWKQDPPKKMTIGYYFDDGLVDISEANRQALLIVKSALEEQGHTLVELSLCSGPRGVAFFAEGVPLSYKVHGARGEMREYVESLQGEKPIEERQRVLEQAQLSNGFKDNLMPILTELHQERMAMVMDATKERSARETVELLGRIETFKQQFEDYWTHMNLDAVLSPAGCLPAIPHKLSSEIFCLNSHFSLYNLLDYPAGVVPVKLVQMEDLKVNKKQEKNAVHQNDRIVEFMRLAQSSASLGLPVGVQVACLPNRDEQCLWLMESIERAIGFNELSLAFIY
ncbi:hypothetical protein FGO68_gene179 [Halteria grandinella]|uniref:Amidase domain-containing protein n=1 Tax=Halteria grandinella TaxID=5974 RepID=A0A8J8NE40_HALGN|nr:hypothetical protein FGO68_gene179 [Halteria grandinella]